MYNVHISIDEELEKRSKDMTMRINGTHDGPSDYMIKVEQCQRVRERRSQK